MRLYKGTYMIATAILLAYTTMAQTKVPAKEHRLLLILDASVGMQQPWNENQTRFNTATHIITSLLDTIYYLNEDVSFALRGYGQDFAANEHNCGDSKLEVMFSKDNRAQMALRLQYLHPNGMPAIGYALEDAIGDLNEQRSYNYYVVIITAGDDSCGEDVCRISDKLKNKVATTPYIICLTSHSAVQDKYGCLGTYLPTLKQEDIQSAINTISSNFKREFTRPRPDKPNPKLVAINLTPVVNSLKQQARQDTVETMQDTSYLFFTSKYTVTKVSLGTLNDDKLTPVNATRFAMPMHEKQIIGTGRYRVTYIITNNQGQPETRVKEFYARDRFYNIVDLD